MSQNLIHGKQHGFTLIELMIVVAVVAILVTIAYPSYTEYTQQSRRSDAMTSLLDAQLAQERFRANNVTYGSSVVSLGMASVSEGGFYNIAVSAADGTSFLVTASPTGVQQNDGCGVFAVDQDGAEFTGYADAECWGR